MRPVPMLMLLACSAVLVTAGCSDDVQPTEPVAAKKQPLAAVSSSPTGRVGHFAATNGSSSGTGTWDRPWDLKTALAGASGKVKPGDTIWVRGGTYRGAYTSTVKGTSSAPVVVRSYPGERATLDGKGSSGVTLRVTGAYSTFWGLEIMNSNTDRTGPRPEGVYAKAPNLKFINMVVHDVLHGFAVQMEAPTAEVYGNIIYNNGYQSSTWVDGHGIYTKNDGSTAKLIRDNILFDNYGYGIHAYTNTGTGQLRNFRIEGNISFNNGSVKSMSSYNASNLLVGGGEPADNAVVLNNMLYFSPTMDMANAKMGYKTIQNGAMTFQGNYVAGGRPAFWVGSWRQADVSGNQIYAADRLVEITNSSLSGYKWGGNQYFGSTSSTAFKYLSTYYSFSPWKQKTGLGSTDASQSGSPTGTKVFVRPNQYEKGRANVAVYNWGSQGSVSVDMSKVLTVGARYEVRNVQAFFGTPVASGTYRGGAISIPMGGVAPTRPIGGSKAALKTAPYFDAFVVTTVAN